MRQCECGSYAINLDPNRRLCDKCLLRADRDDARKAAKWLWTYVKDIDACAEACDHWPWLEQEEQEG